MPPYANQVRDYHTNKLTPAEAIELLRKKTLTDGYYYYIGTNRFDGWIEVFKATQPIKDFELTPEQIQAMLDKKGLYIYHDGKGFITIRKVPKDADKVLQLRQADEENGNV